MAAVAASCFVVALVGTSIGLVLGSIRLPILLLVASSPAAGAGANIGISAVSAGAASVTHVRNRLVNWRLVAWMTPPSMAGAFAGGYFSGLLPSDVLLVVIGLVLVYFGARTLLERPRGAPERRGRLDLRAAVVASLLIGFLGGLVGLILGTLRLPAMIRHVGEAPHRTVATNLIVGLALGVAGVVGHLPSGVDWPLLVVGSAASIPGALVGSRLTGRLSEPQLLKAIAVVLLVVGTATAARGVF
jgi:uncharacterized protein